MVEVIYKDRLGNRMFQYALGRILAEELGYELLAEPLYFNPTKEVVSGKIYNEPSRIFSNQECNVKSILDDRRHEKIILNGWFQRSEYYLPYWAKIKSWYQFSSEQFKMKNLHLRSFDDQDVLIYIRLGDYYSVYRWALNTQFYEAALEMANPGNVYIITEDVTHPYLNYFAKYDPTYLIGDPLSHMSCAMYFKKVIISCSTFSWWGAMLSDATEIYFPLDEDGVWSSWNKKDDNRLDLRIDDDRITYFYNCPTIASTRTTKGLVPLSEILPDDATFHKRSQAFCFV